MADQFTEFNYLLNAFESASQDPQPAVVGYAAKRQALLRHVRELERKAAAYDSLTVTDAMVEAGARALAGDLNNPGNAEWGRRWARAVLDAARAVSQEKP